MSAHCLLGLDEFVVVYGCMQGFACKREFCFLQVAGPGVLVVIFIYKFESLVQKTAFYLNRLILSSNKKILVKKLR
tara:strand:+ start:277 stop:504 length:228 start_codon:yes stop_codon:yes gene_type:complete